MEIKVNLDTDLVNDIVLQDLVSHFETTDLTSEQANALAVVIKFYSTNKEWKQFVERNQPNGDIDLRSVV